jgi:hypothetical protein
VTDEIRPALSAEEWEQVMRFGGPMKYDSFLELLAVEPAPVQRNTMFRMMALANAALPEGDARKFTMHDVRLLRDAASASADYTGGGLDLLCARIDALLPPQCRKQTSAN